jgi:hypothetical protein
MDPDKVNFGKYIDKATLIRDIRKEANVKRSPTKLAEEKKQSDIDEALREYELKKQLMPNVVIDEAGPVDVVRDAKWVYQNIGRLFYRNDLGLEYLDEEFLKTAPSNGAVSMAHYCWNHRKEFFEKFIFTKVAKEDREEERSEDDLAAELDPTFEGLEKYLEKIDA